MTGTTNTRRTRKATTDESNATPDQTDANTPDTATDATPDQTDATEATPTAPAYTIPDWSNDVDQATYVAAVGDAYRSADKAAKAAMRAAWAKFQSDALQDLDVSRLAIVRDVNAVLVSSRPVVEVDPADAYNVTISALRAAAERLYDAFGEEHGAEAQARLDGMLSGDRDEATQANIATMTTKLAVVKSGSRRTGPQRSVEAHIRSALDAAPKGTILTCAQVHNHRSEAYGADESPSVGAIGAAYGREMSGIESVTNDTKVKGFRLA